uniref:Secreted protein n=1 Tax=Rhipicephalus appendiculatus TaxID=34631 RepID=A0A131YDI0_RHIAP
MCCMLLLLQLAVRVRLIIFNVLQDKRHSQSSPKTVLDFKCQGDGMTVIMRTFMCLSQHLGSEMSHLHSTFLMCACWALTHWANKDQFCSLH